MNLLLDVYHRSGITRPRATRLWSFSFTAVGLRALNALTKSEFVRKSWRAPSHLVWVGCILNRLPGVTSFWDTARQLPRATRPATSQCSKLTNFMLSTPRAGTRRRPFVDSVSSRRVFPQHRLYHCSRGSAGSYISLALGVTTEDDCVTPKSVKTMDHAGGYPSRALSSKESHSH